MQVLNSNNSRVIIFETEGDTLSNAFKSDFGDYSDTFRKAFHHENLNLFRRGNSEYISINEPKLSAILSGTPEQIKNLIPNLENGLFSRFLFFLVKIEPQFKNVFEKTGEIINDTFKILSLIIKDLYDSLMKYNKPIIFKLTEEQGRRFLEIFSSWHEEFLHIFGSDSLASERRLGVIFFRIAMILSILDIIVLEQEIICTDAIFDLTLNIISELKEHQKIVLFDYIKNRRIDFIKDSKKDFYQALPNVFKRENAIILGSKFNLSRPTIDRTLQNQNLFKRSERGFYSKKI
jgi:hypothetical protein